jgi:hypothetical protein
MSRKERFKARNKAVRAFFNDLETKNPEWKQKFLIESTANKFFLATRTIEAIVLRESIYAD